MTEPAYPFEQSWPAPGGWTYADYLRLPLSKDPPGG